MVSRFVGSCKLGCNGGIETFFPAFMSDPAIVRTRKFMACSIWRGRFCRCSSSDRRLLSEKEESNVCTLRSLLSDLIVEL